MPRLEANLCWLGVTILLLCTQLNTIWNNILNHLLLSINTQVIWTESFLHFRIFNPIQMRVFYFNSFIIFFSFPAFCLSMMTKIQESAPANFELHTPPLLLILKDLASFHWAIKSDLWFAQFFNNIQGIQTMHAASKKSSRNFHS